MWSDSHELGRGSPKIGSTFNQFFLFRGQHSLGGNRTPKHHCPESHGWRVTQLSNEPNTSSTFNQVSHLYVKVIW